MPPVPSVGAGASDRQMGWEKAKHSKQTVSPGAVWLVPSGQPDSQPSIASCLCWWPFYFTMYAAKGGSSSAYMHEPGCINCPWYIYIYICIGYIPAKRDIRPVISCGEAQCLS